MVVFKVSDNIIPIGEFKTRASKWLKKVKNTGHPLIITQNGKPAGVLLSPYDYDKLTYTKEFIDSVNRGLQNADTGNTYSTTELQEELTKRRISRKSE